MYIQLQFWSKDGDEHELDISHMDFALIEKAASLKIIKLKVCVNLERFHYVLLRDELSEGTFEAVQGYLEKEVGKTECNTDNGMLDIAQKTRIYAALKSAIEQMDNE